MRKWTVTLTCAWLMFAAAGAAAESPVKVMSFNIRYDNPGDKENNWQFRRDRAANAILFYAPDVIGTQEVLHNQLMDLEQRIGGVYAHVGVGREDGHKKGEYAALWYNRDRFDALDSGNFWLSETPEKMGSKGWDGACERIATWAILRDRRSNSELLVMNTHLDHAGTIARRLGAELLLHRADSLAAGRPIIITGDFNSEPSSEVVVQLTSPEDARALTDSRAAAPLVYGPAWTFHDFGRLDFKDRELIDYVFVRGLDVESFGVMAETDENQFLSDHAPVIANLKVR